MSKKRKVYMFYKINRDETGLAPPTPELYGFTENKYLANLSLSTRGRNSIIMRKKNVDELILPVFENNNRDMMIFMNVLTDGNNSFDFPTTYYEDYLLTTECENIHERFLKLNDLVFVIPFTDEVLDAIDVVKQSIQTSLLDEDGHGAFNTFEIFMRLFKDTLV